jgi:DNA-binding MarR family transcriptional regulator
MRLTYLVGRVDRVMTSLLEDAIVPLGVTLTELTALSVLAVRPGLSNARLARRSLVSPQAMHKVMRSLEEAGLITRAVSEQGGRSLHAQITDRGLDVLEQADELLDEVERRFTESLDQADREALEALLRRVAAVDPTEPDGRNGNRPGPATSRSAEARPSGSGSA